MAESTISEQVNHPQHYGGDTVYETIKVLESKLTPEEYIGFLKGNAIKYLTRAGKKASALEDVLKAQWYINELVRVLKQPTAEPQPRLEK